MRFSYESLPPADKILTAAASAILLKSIASDLIPQQIQTYLSSSLAKLSRQLTVVVDEFDSLTSNQMFDAATVYLAAKISGATTRIKVNKPPKQQDLAVAIDKNQDIVNIHASIHFKWTLQSATAVTKTAKNESSRSELRYFELSFNRKHKDYVLKVYLPYILARAKEMKEEVKTVRLHTVDYNGTDYWSSVALNHPATFKTMAMEPEMKKGLMEDLDRFVNRKDYYRWVGKAWKRGYLMYGPPGTGKSSLVAAMANYLKFDVYDLDLR
ncbi:AAA-ATPase-like protein [Salvia divinorum]|uniref:AAA-ATPase-like protein n=1 Tax=Salvia divinorum TaxID=28513 RepID=A0ABD1GRK2_SALDI